MSPILNMLFFELCNALMTYSLTERIRRLPDTSLKKFKNNRYNFPEFHRKKSLFRTKRHFLLKSR